MRFLKGAAEIATMLVVVAVVSKASPGIGLLLCLLVLPVALFSVILPLPKLRLPYRPYNFAVAIFVGLLGTAIPIVISSAEQKRMEELRSTDPAAYLSELKDHDRTKWLSELETLDPTQYAEVKAKADAEEAEAKARAEAAQKEAAREKARQFAEAEKKRLAAEKKKEEAERAAAQKNLNVEQANLRDQVAAMDWPDAKDTYLRIEKAGVDLTEFDREIEDTAFGLIKSLPASTAADMKANQEGYEFLSALRPENETYQAKATDYAAKFKQARQSVVAKLRRTKDKVEGTIFFEHPNQPKYLNSRSTVYLYIGRQGENGRPWLRMKVQYTASDWLFVENVVAWHDGVKEQFISGRFNRDNNSTIWEWVDVTPTPRQLSILRDLANAKEAVLRFEGMQYRKDVTLSAGDKRALREVLLAYRVMVGED